MVLKESDDYNSMKIGLSDLTVSALADKYFMGGDWKFLTMANSVSSTFACIWCKCPVDQRSNTKKKWSITGTTNSARMMEENVRLCISAPSTMRLPSITLTNVIVDNLHLYLQVMFLYLSIL